MNIIENRIITGLLQDDKDITRALAASVSQLTVQVTLLSEMFPYLMSQSTAEGSFIPVAYLVERADKFKQQLTLLREQVAIMDEIENLRSSDAETRTKASRYFSDKNTGKTFTDRYK